MTFFPLSFSFAVAFPTRIPPTYLSRYRSARTHELEQTSSLQGVENSRLRSEIARITSENGLLVSIQASSREEIAKLKAALERAENDAASAFGRLERLITGSATASAFVNMEANMQQMEVALSTTKNVHIQVKDALATEVQRRVDAEADARELRATIAKLSEELERHSEHRGEMMKRVREEELLKRKINKLTGEKSASESEVAR